MQSKNIDKHKETFRELEKQISPVLVVNNNALKPYVESFQYSPENVYQQPLGILLGFFEIKEYSEDSAYIVNFLNSVLKKEYYINPKRTVTESLDSALHKVNLALSEVAKHGNINWLGKLDGAVCILEKNNLHFSVAGDAKVLLHRKQVFTDISEGLVLETDEPHPLKTFINVSSGRLENHDKLLITSNDIFQIISLPQLTKNAARFSQEQFVQFIRTALSNELELASVIVVDAAQKKAVPRKTVVAVPETPIAEPELVNVFSEKTFAQTKAQPKQAAQELATEEMPVASLPENEESHYTDKKTGHIYIQGQSEELPATSPWQASLALFKEHAWDFFYETKKELRRNTVAAKKTLRLARKSIALKLAELKKPTEPEVPEPEETPDMNTSLEEIQERHVSVMEIPEEPIQDNQVAEVAPEPIQTSLEKERIVVAEIKPATPIQDLQPTNSEPEEIQAIPVHRSQKISAILDEEDFQIGSNETPSRFKAKLAEAVAKLNSQKREASWEQDANAPEEKPNLGSLMPDFGKIQKLFARFSGKQKMYLLVAIAAIVLVPLVANKLFSSPKPTPAIEAPKEPSLAEVLAQDKNIQLTTQTVSLANTTDAKNVLLFEDAPYFITDKTITTDQAGQQQAFNIPLEGNETVLSSAFMTDLKMILLLTSQKRILSFSPVSQQFKVNNIRLPDSAKLEFVGTYLTYLYVTDPAASQVYRYPRAEGGFGEKTDWLKNTVSLTNISALTIDDSIYFVQNNKINKLFKGQVETVNFENSQTPVIFSNIFTTIDLDNIYVLDAKNARVLVYAKTGEIVKQYFNETFRGAATLTVSEKTASAYVTTSTGVIKLAL